MQPSGQCAVISFQWIALFAGGARELHLVAAFLESQTSEQLRQSSCTQADAQSGIFYDI